MQLKDVAEDKKKASTSSKPALASSSPFKKDIFAKPKPEEISLPLFNGNKTDDSKDSRFQTAPSSSRDQSDAVLLEPAESSSRVNSALSRAEIAESSSRGFVENLIHKSLDELGEAMWKGVDYKHRRSPSESDALKQMDPEKGNQVHSLYLCVCI